MKRNISFNISLLITSLIIFTNCGSKRHTPSPQQPEVKTGITHRGELKAAEDGPVRSALGNPRYTLDTLNLKVTGLVKNQLSIPWDSLKTWPTIQTDTLIMYCVEGWEVWGVWRGVSVAALLEKAGLDSTGTYVLFRCLEGYTTALPVAYLIKYNSLLAYEVNGKPLKDSDGFPLRLVAPGKFGYKWAKWVQQLHVMNTTSNGFWEVFGYSDEANVPIERRQYYEGDNAVPLEY